MSRFQENARKRWGDKPALRMTTIGQWRLCGHVRPQRCSDCRQDMPVRDADGRRVYSYSADEGRRVCIPCMRLRQAARGRELS